MDNPKVSVQVPLYNAEKYIVGTLRSILADTAESVEIMVGDDNSTDNSLTLVQELAAVEPRIRVLTASDKLGGAGWRRRMVETTDAEYVVPFDADDLFIAGRIDRQRQMLESNRNAVAVYGKNIFWDMRENRVGYHSGRPFSNFLFFSGNQLGHCSGMIRRSALLAAGNYREPEFDGITVGVAFDYFMWQRLSNLGDMLFEPVFTYVYRIHGDQLVFNKADLYASAHRCMAESFRAENYGLMDDLLNGRAINFTPDMRPVLLKALGLLSITVHSLGISPLPFIQTAAQIAPEDYGSATAECEFWGNAGDYHQALATADRMAANFTLQPFAFLGALKLRQKFLQLLDADKSELEKNALDIAKMEAFCLGTPEEHEQIMKMIQPFISPR